MSQGERVATKAGDISSAGMLLHVGQPSGFALDEVVSVETELPHHPDAFSAWGIASVARTVDNDVALRACASNPFSADSTASLRTAVIRRLMETAPRPRASRATRQAATVAFVKPARGSYDDSMTLGAPS